MAFSDKIKAFVDQGLSTSKDILSKVGDKAQQWGELGVLKVEIIQLRSQAQKLTAKLGAEVYETLVEKGQHNVSRDSPAIKETLGQVEELETRINEKELLFKTKGGKEEDLKEE
ncbi:MAG: hypothetical protein E4H20_09240 [Spirochaetales bacterium]|nr:MAG: hypothetical protein E4H20_09240 [Spirochaetales bacterium]